MADSASPAAPVPGLSPYLVCDGAADAIAFYKDAFGAQELMRLDGEDGKIMHAALTINGAMVMLTDERKEFGTLGPRALGGTPVILHLAVANADEAIARAAAAGATVTMPAQDMFWGDRYGQIADPFGHSWSIAHTLQTLSEDEVRAAAKDAMCGQPGGD